MNGLGTPLPPGRVGHPARAAGRSRRPPAAARPADAGAPDLRCRRRPAGRPPAAAGPGNPCPTGAPTRSFAVSAVDLPATTAATATRRSFVPTADAAAVKAGTKNPEPLVLHVAAGDCVNVTSRTSGRRPAPRFHVSKLDARPPSRPAINVGFNPEQTVARGATRSTASTPTRASSAARRSPTSALEDTRRAAASTARSSSRRRRHVHATRGPARRRTSAPRSTCTCPASRATATSPCCSPTTTRASAAAHALPDGARAPAGADQLPQRAAGRRHDDVQLVTARGDPATPLLRAYAGDRFEVHALGAPGSEQRHVFSLGGLAGGPTSGSPRAPSSRRRASRPGRRSRPRRWAARGAGRAAPATCSGRSAAAVHRGLACGGSCGRSPTRSARSGRCRDATASARGPSDRPPRPRPLPARRPRPGRSRAGTQPLEPVTSITTPAPLTATPWLSGLVLPSTTSKAQLRRGVRLGVTAPASTRMLRVELRRAGSRSPAAVTELAVPRGGTVATTWRLPAHDRAPADRRLRGQRRGRIDRPAPHGPDDVAMSGQRRSSSPSATCVLPFISRKAMASATSATGAT